MSIQDRIKSERLNADRAEALVEATLDRAEALGIDMKNYDDAISIITNDLDDALEFKFDEVADESPSPTDPDFGAAVDRALSVQLSDLIETVQLAARNLKELETQIIRDQARIAEHNLRSE